MTTTAQNVAPAPGTALPCPLCQAEMVGVPEGFHHPAIGDCPIEGNSWASSYYLAAWNTRTPDPALAAENARLIALVGEMREAFEAISQHSGGTQFSTIVGMRKIARALVSKAGAPSPPASAEEQPLPIKDQP